MRTLVVDHPLAAALLTTMRDERTGNAEFRAALAELTRMLVFEATRDVETERFEVRTPVGMAVGTRVSNPPLLVPVLRAGLGMIDQATALIPEARVGFVGLARNEQTHAAHEYMVSLPADLSEIPVLVLDPMLATGGSLLHVVELLVKRGARDITVICVVAAPEGIHALEEAGHPLNLVTAAVDSHLNENAYIVPGLGDAGDRQFGPR